MCRRGEARPLAAGSYELAARYRCNLPAGEASWRSAGYRMARTGTRALLYQHRGDRSTRLLGTHQGGSATSNTASMDDPPGERAPRANPRIQRLNSDGVGRAGAVAGE